MNRDEINLEECKTTWREHARKQAAQEAKENGLQGNEAQKFIAEREPELYAELAKLGEENIS